MPRKKKTMDGNAAAAYVAYAFTEVAAIYPITPSSNMAEETDKMAAAGAVNLFGQPVRVTQMQSEGGAAGAVHGSLTAGALTTTYTSSQGLLLMIPNLYKMAGELLPGVIHVAARAVATHALSIFGDHSDIYACRQTGAAMLCSDNPQEVMDLGAVAHLSALLGHIPFLHFFDGFRTSHEIQKIELWDYAMLEELLDKNSLRAFRGRALNPEHPVQRGTAQNPDIFFQNREAANLHYDAIPGIVADYMDKVNTRLGTDYQLFNYYGATNADRILIAMGSVCDTVREAVDILNNCGARVGMVSVHLYRPFSTKHLLSAIPDSVTSISVLDRTKEPGAPGEPLYLDVCSALRQGGRDSVMVYGGRYGLGSKDTTVGQILAVFDNMQQKQPKPCFTIGIRDNVTGLSLAPLPVPIKPENDVLSCKFWGLGSDGTVGANKNTLKIIGDNTDLYVQGYFDYDSKKSGGVTISHLRFSQAPITAPYLVAEADFVACHNPSYLEKYDIYSDIKPGGTLLINCPWSDRELEMRLPPNIRRHILDNHIRLYAIDAGGLAKKLGLGRRVNTILQAAFFKLTGLLEPDIAKQLLMDAIARTYGKKGDEVIQMNNRAIEAGFEAVRAACPSDAPLPYTKMESPRVAGGRAAIKPYVDNILSPVNAMQGNSLPVSAFTDYVDGTVPLGSSAYEKRGVATDVPQWLPDNCIQCNFCSYVCPHAVIRPAVLNAEEAANAPKQMELRPMTGTEGLNFAIRISVLDCTGCGCCATVCPGKQGNKALVMQPIDTRLEQQEVFVYAEGLQEKADVKEKWSVSSVKGSQFQKPLLEFSGACAGCGEPAYARLATQLFGERMYIANATGCSSIWGGSAPSTPYTVGKSGRGPAWHNSLFEDNAEFGYGMLLANIAIRKRLTAAAQLVTQQTENKELRLAAEQWLSTRDSGIENAAPAAHLKQVLLECAHEPAIAEAIDRLRQGSDYLAKKSVWLFGGDGWAYDIDFGGLDHVLASGEDINVLVFDTEVYSNTGGQASKSTPIGSVVQFAAAGKETAKKNLAAIAMTYGNVYVAQVAQGADFNQCIKAFWEAEQYNGPSLLICYAPCINHGIKGGMSLTPTEQKRAVAAGYWDLFRFNPSNRSSEKPVLALDSKPATADYNEFIMGEVRYSALARANPARAKALFAQAEQAAKARRSYLETLQELYNRPVQ